MNMASAKLGKSRGQANAKEAIGALCHILNSNCCITKITPEQFRQAKFDKPEALSSMWLLLKELLHLHQSSLNSSAAELENEDVQTLLYQLGYRCVGFYGNSDIRSRDLLLAIGWLLAKTDFVNAQVQFMIDDTSASASSFHRGAVQKTLSENISKVSRQFKKVSSPSSHVGQAKYIVWLLGRLRLTHKALYCDQQGLCSAMHHVHKATQGVSMPHPSHINHLSAWQSFILRHPNQLQQYILQLEKQSSILHACLTWRDAEPVFWQWMVSVQETKMQSVTDNTILPPSLNGPFSSGFIASKEISRRVEQLHDLEIELSRQLLDLDDEIESRGAIDLLNQLSDHPDIHKRKADIENAVSAKVTSCLAEERKVHCRGYPIKTVQFSFKPDQVKHRRAKQEPLPHNTLHVNDEIARLSEGVRRLQEELDSVKLKQQQRLNGFTEGLVNVVCIPPMSDKSSL